MGQISIEAFFEVEIRVGEIVEAGKVDGSEKLLKMTVDFGEIGKRQVFTGIGKWFAPETFVNKKTAFVTNITPKPIMGQLSEAMILAAEETENEPPKLIFVDQEIRNGSRVI